MRRKTNAPTSVSIGTLVGIMVAVSTDNLVLGILAFVGVTVLGWIAIRTIEKVIWKGADKVGELLFDKASNGTAARQVQPDPVQNTEVIQNSVPKVKRTAEKEIKSGKNLWIFAAVLTLFGILCTFYLMSNYKSEVDAVNFNIKNNAISHDKYKEGDSAYSNFDDEIYEEYLIRDNAILVLYESAFVLAVGSLLAFALLISFRAKQVEVLYALVIGGVGGYLVTNSSSFSSYKMSMFYIYIILIFAAAILHMIYGLSKKSIFAVFAVIESLAVPAIAVFFIQGITMFRRAAFISCIWADLIGVTIIALLVDKSKKKDADYNKALMDR